MKGSLPVVPSAPSIDKSKYNNWLIIKLINIFTDVEERKNEREESLAPMQAPSCTQKYRQQWVPIKMYVRRNRKENEDM
jgi:hypothetical protein